MASDRRSTPEEDTLELREEELVAQRKLEEAGKVRIRTDVENVPGRLEVDTSFEEVEIEHVPVGQTVSERREPWEEEDGVLVLPVYEEQLVVEKRLVLREHVRVRRIAGTRRELFQDTLRRERVVVEDLNETGRVHERYPTGEQAQSDASSDGDGGVIDKIVRNVLQ